MVPLGRILITDPDPSQRSRLSHALRLEGFKTDSAPDGLHALQKLGDFLPDVLLTHHPLPDPQALELLRRGRLLRPSTQLVVMTRDGSIDDAVHAVRGGAVDYLVHPFAVNRWVPALHAAVHRARAHRQSHPGPRTPAEAFDGILTTHPAMRELLGLVRQIAPSRASVLLEGESGTGKDLFARAIHRASLRASQPFVHLSCAELTPTLLESEIFGHEKGAFTGALSRRDGRFKQADGGTLFLDEVSEIPLGTQVKLLRFMQERAFEPVGGNETLHVDVRVLSATNRSLQQAVDDNRFRLDLFYRLNVVSLRIPPLRERASDIPLLAAHFLTRFAKENERHVSTLTDGALDRLATYPWPGNVRELENVIERAVVLCEGSSVEAHHLPPHVAAFDRLPGAPKIPGASVRELEHWAILRTLESVGGSTSRAAQVLGISTRKIQYKLRAYRQHAPRVDPGPNDARMGDAEEET
jgi:DNA-binding NtrC family response regulator